MSFIRKEKPNNRTYSLLFFGLTGTVKDTVKKLNVNFQDRNGYTALHIATKEEMVELVEIFLLANADPYIKNKKGETCFDMTSNDRIKDRMYELYDEISGFNIKNTE